MTQYLDSTIAVPAQESGNAAGLPDPRPDIARCSYGPERHRHCRRIGILGANDTGMRIAASLLAADIPVTLHEGARKPLDMATASLRADYQESVGRGELTAAQRDRRVALLAATVNLHHLKDCDVIVDALGPEPGAREAVIRRLNEVARPDAVLMTCGADDSADRLATLARFPANVLGFRLVPCEEGRQAWELVPVKATSKEALAIAGRLVASLGAPRQAAQPPAMSLA